MARKGVRLSVFSGAGNGVAALYEHRFLLQPAFRVSAVDPTGAGDALCAGMAKTLSSLAGRTGFPDSLSPAILSRMLLYSQAAGAACVGKIGTTAGVTKSRVSRLMASQGGAILRKTKLE